MAADSVSLVRTDFFPNQRHSQSNEHKTVLLIAKRLRSTVLAVVMGPHPLMTDLVNALTYLLYAHYNL